MIVVPTYNMILCPDAALYLPLDMLRRSAGHREITVGEKLTQVEWDYPDFHLSMGCYWCALKSGSLTLREHESASWLSLNELDAVDWLPADRALLPQII